MIHLITTEQKFKSDLEIFLPDNTQVVKLDPCFIQKDVDNDTVKIVDIAGKILVSFDIDHVPPQVSGMLQHWQDTAPIWFNVEAGAAFPRQY
jgi:hypothetical protein